MSVGSASAAQCVPHAMVLVVVGREHADARQTEQGRMWAHVGVCVRVRACVCVNVQGRSTV